MYRSQTVAVVVPAYNEEGFVGEVLDTMPEFVDRIYAVDDCSTDGTWAEIQRRTEDEERRRRAAQPDGGTRAPRLTPIRHERNKGVGGAIKTGYTKSLEDGNDIVAVMNGDGQMDPNILDRILDPVAEQRADYAKGDRLYSSEFFSDMSRWRFFGNALLTFLTKVASGYWSVNDSQNGYTAISRSALQAIDIDSLYDQFGFCNDLLVRLNRHGFRIEDVEMRAKYGDEESHIRYSTFIPRLSVLLLHRFLWRLKVTYVVGDFHPLVFLYGIGQLGFLTVLGSVGLLLFTGVGDHLSVLVTVLIFLLSCITTVWAMAFDKQYSERYA